MSYYPLTPIYVRYGERKSYTSSINLTNKLIYTFMKKLFLSIATLSLMSFTSVKLYHDYKLSESLSTIQDMKEYMKQYYKDSKEYTESGKLQIERDKNKVKLVQGQAIFFASFLLHKVAPVTRGVRKSLVMWFGGPPLR